MKIELIEKGFVEFPENGTIEKIICKYDGMCTVYDSAGLSRSLSVECSSYNSQMGFPVSCDGRMLFTSSWENGLTAYDISSGNVIWRFKRSRITKMIPYNQYIVAERYGKSIIKFDIQTGEVLSEIKSGTVGHKMWELPSPYILVDRIRGKLIVVDTEDMTVKKAYKENIVDPNQCLSLLIQGRRFQDGVLSIYGVESYPNRNPSLELKTYFERVIDSNFFENL